MQLIFEDIDDITYAEKYILFNKEKATSILDFVESNLTDSIVVNCHAGVCRSVATAAALSKILNNEYDNIFKSGCPNMLIYSTILRTYFLEDNFHLRWPKIWKVRYSNLRDV